MILLVVINDSVGGKQAQCWTMWRLYGPIAGSTTSPPPTCSPCATLLRLTLPGAGRLLTFPQVLPHTLL